MSQPKYHVFLEHAEDNAKSGVRFNMSEEEIVRVFVTPFLEGKPFWFCGRLLDPGKVERVVIFWSYEDGSSLVLPNRELVAGNPDRKLVLEKICAGRVKGAYVCTDRFLKPR